MKRNWAPFLFLLALPLAAQQPAAEKPPAKSSVKGIVLKVGTDDPVRRAVVSLEPSEDRRTPYHTATDSEGRFELKGIPPGRYVLSVNREGHLLQKIGVGEAWASSQRLRVTLTAGQELKVIAYMIPGAVVAGRVLDADGEPLSRIVVEALRFYGRHSYEGESFETNDLGEYRIHGLKPGRYYLRAQPGWNRPRTVATSAASPGSAGEALVYVQTFYPGVPERSQATRVELLAGREARVDFVLAPARAVHVRGRLVAKEGKIDPQSAVMLLPRFGDLADPEASAPVRLDGTFEIEAVVPGSYILIVYTNSAEGAWVVSRQRVEVGDSGVDDLVAAFMPPLKSSLEGRVRVEGGSDVALRDFQVSVVLDPPDEDREFPFFGSGFRGLARANPDGSFIIENLQDGRFRVRVVNEGAGRRDLADFYLKSATVADRDVLRSRLWVYQGQIGGSLELVLSSSAARIEGIVLAENEKPAASVGVVTVPDEKRRDFGDDYQFQVTDQNGHFVMRSVRPGEYKLFAWDNDGEFFDYRDPDFLKKHESKGVTVTLKEGEHRSVPLRSFRIEGPQ